MKFRFNIYVWGRGRYDQLGLDDDRDRHIPTLLDRCSDDKAEWTQIVGGLHTAALTKDGKVFAWGNNRQGDLGHGDRKKNSNIPTKVESLDGLFIVKIACGEYHTVAITDDGDIYTWYVSRTTS